MDRIASKVGRQNLLVICPLSLTHKWKAELLSKFNIDAPILSAKELLDVLNSKTETQSRRYISALETASGLIEDGRTKTMNPNALTSAF